MFQISSPLFFGMRVNELDIYCCFTRLHRCCKKMLACWLVGILIGECVFIRQGLPLSWLYRPRTQNHKILYIGCCCCCASFIVHVAIVKARGRCTRLVFSYTNKNTKTKQVFSTHSGRQGKKKIRRYSPGGAGRIVSKENQIDFLRVKPTSNPRHPHNLG
jgi:hypothetical protein